MEYVGLTLKSGKIVSFFGETRMSIMDPPRPADEWARLEKLKSYDILDTPADGFFDRLTRLGARHFDVPICLVSLVDEGRQWFKSRCGLNFDSTPRRLSFCAHAILQDEVMVVSDAMLDERFADNDLVTGTPNIRFYAGAPIKTPDGYRLGTFCIIDRRARADFDERAAQDLEEFASLVIQQLEADAAKREAERAQIRLQAMFQAAADAILAFDEAGLVLSANPAAERLFGYDAGDMAGGTIGAFLPAFDASAAGIAESEAAPFAVQEITAARSDGTAIPVSVTVARWSENGLPRFAVTVRDVSEREQAIRSQQQSLRLLEAILESVKDPIFVKDEEGRYLTVNMVSARILGRSRDDVIGRTDETLFSSDVAANLRRLDRQAIETNNPVREQQTFQDFATGVSLTFETVKTPLRDENGAVIGLVGIARDVTDQKRAEQALRASEERLRMLVECTPQPMWVNHPDGTLEHHNRAWRDYTALVMDEGSRMEAVHPDDLAHVQAVRTAALRGGEPYEFEIRLRRADGVYRRNMVRVHPLVQEGRIAAWIGMAIDIEDIHRGREAAEEASRSKTSFLASASHDLRQPVQSALLFVGALAAFITDEDGRGALRGLQGSLEALKWMLDGLLDVSRLDAGIVTAQVKTFPVAEVLSQVAQAYAPMAVAKGLRLHAEPCDAQVRSDPLLLGRILRNLLENAVRYTEAGEISLLCTDMGDHLTIQVQDTGIGIPPDHLNRIFDEFHQVSNSERDRSQGLGLGLAIVKRLAHLLDHPVEVRSSLYSGTAFTIRVPHVATAKPVPPVSEPPANAGRPGQPHFAVIVDDDAFVLQALQTIVKRWGFEVLAAGATDEAVEHLRQEGRRPDVLLVDYRLRDGRVGTEAVRRIREMFGLEMPAAIITGEISPEPQKDALDLGLTLMQKPVMPRELAAVLSKLIGKPIGTEAPRS